METFTLVPRGPFSLAASIRFLEGFTPAAYGGPPVTLLLRTQQEIAAAGALRWG